MMTTFFKTLLYTVLFSVAIMVMFYVYRAEMSMQGDAQIIKHPQYKPFRNNVTFTVSPKRFLLYTKWFGSSIWWDYTQPNYDINTKQCHMTKCILTTDKSKFQESDAVLFHGRDMPSQTELKELLRKKPKDQLWVWNIFESPKHTFTDLRNYDDMFHWTATYRLDSEMYLPYYRTLPLKVDDPKPEPGKNFATGRDRMIIAIISNCAEDRINMVRKLKEYVSFDLYGACSSEIPQTLKESCPKNSKECETLQKRYKFYFAMENTYCEDYITEKFYKNSLLHGAVPIVFGGKGGPDYTNILSAPPNSYINALNFKDMKSLGDYLNYLNSNDTAYNVYHAWRYKYKIEFGWSMCEVCDKLWNPPKTKTGINLSNYFSEQGCTKWDKILVNFSK